MQKNKSILFICPVFFNYHIHIIAQMEKMGYSVDFFSDRLSENKFSKAVLKIFPKLLRKKVDKYMESILKATEGKQYDYVFFVTCKYFSTGNMRKLKDAHGQSTFVLYLWDSVRNSANTKNMFCFFDKVYSFDSKDCECYPQLIFEPLFYIDAYSNMAAERAGDDFRQDIFTSMTCHPSRYRPIKEIESYCKDHSISFKFNLFLHTRWQFLYNKLFYKEFRKAKKRDFLFKSIPVEQVIIEMGNSKAILDIPHNKQTGLTMRTIECLGARKKLITTNKDIVNYDFFDNKNILLISEGSIDIPSDFLNSEYRDIDAAIYEKYALKNWLKRILGESK